MTSTVFTMYAIILVCVYVAFSYAELATFPKMNNWLEAHGFFIFLYLISNVYFIYVLAFLVRGPASPPAQASVLPLASEKTSRELPERRGCLSKLPTFRIVNNLESHGSLAVRVGAIVFGIGSLIYFSVELLQFSETLEMGGPCLHPAFGASGGLAVIFIVLQTYIIFMYPRMNIQCHQAFNGFCLMHLVATNIILWFRTLIKESIEEIVEFEEAEHHLENGRPNLTAGGEEHLSAANNHPKGLSDQKQQSCSSLFDSLVMYEEDYEEGVCTEFRHNLVDQAAMKAIPYMYPFVIEFVLIGASVALVMSQHIGVPISPHPDQINRIKRPHPKNFVRLDWSHTLKGALAGLAIFVVALINLGLFFGLDGYQYSKDTAEYISKGANSLINAAGIVACVIGIVVIQSLDHMKEHEGRSFQYNLLLFASTFTLLYNIFTIITGAFSNSRDLLPNGLHVANGVLEIVQVVLQLMFLGSLKDKYLTWELNEKKPGRQVTMFLFLYNLAQWLVYCFEIQKVKASLVEVDFYGFNAWIVIQRVTLPMAVFFRFHSTVVSVEMWKNIYSNPDNQRSLPQPLNIAAHHSMQATEKSGPMKSPMGMSPRSPTEVSTSL